MSLGNAKCCISQPGKKYVMLAILSKQWQMLVEEKSSKRTTLIVSLILFDAVFQLIKTRIQIRKVARTII